MHFETKTIIIQIKLQLINQLTLHHRIIQLTFPFSPRKFKSFITVIFFTVFTSHRCRFQIKRRSRSSATDLLV